MGQEMDNNDATPLREELTCRTKDLEKGVQVISGQEPMSVLEDAITDIHKRTQSKKEKLTKMERQVSPAQEAEQQDREEWLSMMEALQTAMPSCRTNWLTQRQWHKLRRRWRKRRRINPIWARWRGHRRC